MKADILSVISEKNKTKAHQYTIVMCKAVTHFGGLINKTKEMPITIGRIEMMKSKLQNEFNPNSTEARDIVYARTKANTHVFSGYEKFSFICCNVLKYNRKFILSLSLFLSSISVLYAQQMAEDMRKFIDLSSTVSSYLSQGNNLAQLRIAMETDGVFSNYSIKLDDYYDYAIAGLDSEVRQLNNQLGKIDVRISSFSGNDEAIELLQSQRQFTRNRLTSLSVSKSTFQTLRNAGTALDVADVVFSGIELAEDIQNDQVTYHASVFPVLNSLTPFAVSATTLSGGTALAASAFGPVSGLAGGGIILTDKILDQQRDLGDVYRERVYSLREEYYRQFNSLAEISVRDGRARAFEVEGFYRIRRREIVEELLEIERKLTSSFLLNDGELPFSGKSDLAGYAAELASFLDDNENAITLRQQNFVDRYLERYEAAQGIQSDFEIFQTLQNEAEIEISLPSNVINDIRNGTSFLEDNDDGEAVLGNNAGTNIEIQPTGPTPAENTNTDLIDDIIEDLVVVADPRVNLRGVFTATGDDGITTGFRRGNAGLSGVISSGSNTGPLLRYYGYQGVANDDPDAYYELNSGNYAIQPSGYSHLYWGNWRGISYSPGGPGACVIDASGNQYCGIQEYDGAYWLLGVPTTQHELSSRSGSAYYAGRLRGDYDTGSSIQRDAISGDIAIDIGFSSGNVTGRLDFNLNGREWITARLDGSLQDVVGDPGFYALLTGVGERSSGSIEGRFYGLDASETGGQFHFSDWDSGTASGIFYAQDGGGSFDDPLTHVELYTGEYLYNFNTSSYEVETGNSSGMTASAVTEFRDGYDYTSWGTWGVDPSTGLTTGLTSISAIQSDTNWRSGAWVAGQTTRISDRPHSGTATFNGDAVGVSTFGDVVSGDITMEADFRQDTISANMNLSTSDGNHWASASGNGNIYNNNPSNTVGFSGTGRITGEDQSFFGFIGTFNGPNAEEAAGSWILKETNDPSMPEVAGIFRAQQ